MDEIILDEITLTKHYMLYIEEFEMAVMADFHIGYEDVMAQSGIFLPKIQKDYTLRLLDKVFERYDPRILIIDGDLKHEFSRNVRQEWDEIEEIVDYIAESREIIVVRGNHDNYLKSILKRKGIELVDQYTRGRYLFSHGHREVDIGNKILIMGHEHPSVTLRDEVLATIKVPCFLVSDDIIVLPAVSPYASGTDITRSDFLSPILRKKRRDFEIFGIDENLGVFRLGRLSSLLPAPFEG